MNICPLFVQTINPLAFQFPKLSSPFIYISSINLFCCVIFAVAFTVYTSLFCMNSKSKEDFELLMSSIIRAAWTWNKLYLRLPGYTTLYLFLNCWYLWQQQQVHKIYGIIFFLCRKNPPTSRNITPTNETMQAVMIVEVLLQPSIQAMSPLQLGIQVSV